MPANEVMLETIERKLGEAKRDLRMQEKRREKKDKVAGEVEIKNFEGVKVAPEDLLAYMKVGFPETWTKKANVGQLKLDPHFVPMPYPGYENLPEYGHCLVPWGGEPAEIVLTSERFKEKSQYDNLKLLFGRVLSHEFAHANDWKASPDLKPQESLELRFKVMEASMSPERPRFWYPEGIEIKPGNEKQAGDERAVEYFAELVSTVMEIGRYDRNIDSWATWEAEIYRLLQNGYQASPEQARENARLASWYLKKVDPSFKPWIAARERARVEKKIFSDYAWRMEIESIEKIPDETLRRELALGLHMEKEEAGKELEIGGIEYAKITEWWRDNQPALNSPEHEAYALWTAFLGEAEMARRTYWDKNGQYSANLHAAEEFARDWEMLTEQQKVGLKPKLLKYARMSFTRVGRK